MTEIIDCLDAASIRRVGPSDVGVAAVVVACRSSRGVTSCRVDHRSNGRTSRLAATSQTCTRRIFPAQNHTHGHAVGKVDEIHNLNLDTRAGEELSDHLKYFTEHLPATFVYAGIDVERSGVFTGTRGRQLAGRCAVINTSAFPYGHEWKPLVAAMEGTLRLHRHEPGTLVREAKYLHQRTGGMIGSLAHLIRSAAIRSMLDQSEQITRQSMDSVLIDYAAQASAQRSAS